MIVIIFINESDINSRDLNLSGFDTFQNSLLTGVKMMYSVTDTRKTCVRRMDGFCLTVLKNVKFVVHQVGKQWPEELFTLMFITPIL